MYLIIYALVVVAGQGGYGGEPGQGSPESYGPGSPYDEDEDDDDDEDPYGGYQMSYPDSYSQAGYQQPEFTPVREEEESVEVRSPGINRVARSILKRPFKSPKSLQDG